MKLYLIAGEASGDARAAEVMRALTPLIEARGGAVEYFGAGGPQMQALAPAIQDWSGEAVVGLWDVLKKYGYFKRQFNAMLREIAERQPDAVILVDYPGFNLRIAKALKRRNPKLRILYYISPQVWAWNRGRIPKMARYLDLMLCLFPFEKPLYEASGLKTVFVGHPMLDTLAPKKDSVAFPREPDCVGLFPGSRTKEVQRIFPVQLETARVLLRADPQLRLEAAAASEPLAATMRGMVAAAGLPVTVTVGNAHALMQRAGAGMVASGTATLEAAFFELPFVLIYKVAPVTWAIGKRLVRVPHLGMANILAGREIIPEFLQKDARPEAIAKALIGLLRSPETREAQQAAHREVIAGLGGSGAGQRAAHAILDALNPLGL